MLTRPTVIPSKCFAVSVEKRSERKIKDLFIVFIVAKS